MEGLQCNFTNCSEIPLFSCNCSSPAILVCGSHTAEHSLSGFRVSHTTTPIFAELFEEELEVLRKSKQKLLRIKTETLSNITRAHLKEVALLHTKYMNELKSVNQKVNRILKEIEAVISVRLIRRAQPNKLILNILDGAILNEIGDDLYIKNFLSDTKKDLQQEPKISFTPNSLYSYSFPMNSKSLIRVNNRKKTGKSIKIEGLEQNLGYAAGICQLPSGLIFYCGGYDGIGHMKACYLIDPVRKSAEIREKCLSRTQGSCLFT